MLFTLALLSLSLILGGVSSQACEKVITVDITSNGSLTLPMVSQVVLVSTQLSGSLLWTQGSTRENITNTTYTINLGDYDDDNYTVTDGQRTFRVELSYDEDVITCQSLTLNIEYTSQANITTTCIPIASCTINTTINTITWMKSFFPNDRYHQLYNGVYVPPSYTLLDAANDVNVISLSSVTVNGNTVINNATLTIMDPNMNSVGFYEVYDDDSGILLHTFTVFKTISLVSDTESLNVIKGTNDPYRGIHCVFEAFPQSTVTWTRGENSESAVTFNDDDDGVQFYNVIRSDTGSNYTGVDNGVVQFTYTVSGGVVFDEVQYYDAGFYYCTADNGFDVLESHIRLRVRDPLRPLWPALGIVAVFIITALFIVAGAIGDKIRDDKGATLDPTEINAAFSSPHSQRLSVADDEVSPNRRTSSSVQLLPVISGNRND